MGENKFHATRLFHVSGAPKDCFLQNICSEKQINMPGIFYHLIKEG